MDFYFFLVEILNTILKQYAEGSVYLNGNNNSIPPIYKDDDIFFVDCDYDIDTEQETADYTDAI